MSDQEPGHGHQAITKVAVHSLFSDVPEGGKLLGHTEQEFFRQLDHWQSYADGFPLGRESHGHVNRWDGDTYITSSLAPGAQAKHAVADPSKSAGWNLAKIHNYIVDSLMTARACHLDGDREGEWRALGGAIHCLQDSYSSAHMFRDPTHPDDPNASIQAINTFAYGSLGDNYRNGDTHEEVFDKVPVTDGRLERATDRASADGSSTILHVYVHNLHSSEDGAYNAFIVALDPMLHGPDATVFHHRLAYEMGMLGPKSLGYNDPAYQAQRKAHFHNEVCKPEIPASFGPGLHADQPAIFGDHDGPMSIDPSLLMSPDPNYGQREPTHDGDSPTSSNPNTSMCIDPGTLQSVPPGDAHSSRPHAPDPSTVQSVQPGDAHSSQPHAPDPSTLQSVQPGDAHSSQPHAPDPGTLQSVQPGDAHSSQPHAPDPSTLQSVQPSDARSSQPHGSTAPIDQSTFHNVSIAQSSQTQDPAAVSDRATLMSAGRDIHAANDRFFTADEYRHIVQHDGSHIASSQLVDGLPHAANVNGASSNDDSQVIASVGGDHGLHPGIDPSTLDPAATHSAAAFHGGDHGLHPGMDPSTLDPGATHSAATLHASDHGLHPGIDPSTLDPGATHSAATLHADDHGLHPGMDPSTLDPGATHSAATLHAGDHGLHPGMDPSTLDPGATHSAAAFHGGDHGLHPGMDPSTLDPGATHLAATLHASDHGLHPGIDPSTPDPGATDHSVTSSHGSDHSSSVVDHHASPVHNGQLDHSHSAAHTAAAHTAGSDHDAAIVG